jgi:PPM family protein phosphatase
MVRCAACDTPAGAEDRFCEVCGHDLRGTVESGTQWPPSGADSGVCVDGQEHPPAASGQHCWQVAAGRSRAELRIGTVAGVTDRGRHRSRNEDAVALGRTGLATAAVVCDGVSSSSRPDTAASAAVHAGITAILQALTDGLTPPAATQGAARAAVSAVAALDRPDTSHNPPSCTYVSAVVTADEVTVGWVGDSRAYWLADAQGAAGSTCLTVDDTLTGQLEEAGVKVPTELDLQAGALIRWVGADARDVEPHIITFAPPGAGRVLLCSDGLSRYLSAPADLASATMHDPPDVAARRLTQLALDAGGHDNITVAVVPFPPVRDGGSRQAQITGEPSR